MYLYQAQLCVCYRAIVHNNFSLVFRSRNDSLNILVDVLPPDAPTTNRESTLVSLDINRHKEIIVKAISATLLLLLKHFKVSSFTYFIFYWATSYFICFLHFSHSYHDSCILNFKYNFVLSIPSERAHC